MTRLIHEGGTPELIELIGEDGLRALAERYGGTRMYVPIDMHANHDLVTVLGLERATALSTRLGLDVIRVPLARELRALHLRASGMSNSQIASALVMTETGVNKLFARLSKAGQAVPTSTATTGRRAKQRPKPHE